MTQQEKLSVQRVIADFYKRIERDNPLIFFCQSPWQANMEINISMSNYLGENLRANLGANLWANLGAMGANLRANLRDNLRANLETNLGDNLRANLRENLRANLRANLQDNNAIKYNATYLWGQLDASWIAYYLYPHVCIRKMHTAEQMEILSGWNILAQSCNFWWAFDKIVFVSQKFSELHQDSRNRLHNDTGPAMAFGDGYALYAVHGVQIPEYVIVRPQEITVETIHTERNAEVRRVMLDKFGIGRYLRVTHAEKIAGDNWGELFKIELVGDEPILMVRYLNSTPNEKEVRKEYWHRVHPSLRPIFYVHEDGRQELGEPQELTPHNAIASFQGLYGYEYDPDIQT